MTKIIDFTNCILSNRNLQYGGRAGEKRISALSILNFIKNNNSETLTRVYNNVLNHFSEIAEFIKLIPNSFKDVHIISDVRKEYHIKTLKIRLDYIFEEFLNVN